jgi:hypothetical protein
MRIVDKRDIDEINEFKRMKTSFQETKGMGKGQYGLNLDDEQESMV